MGHESPERAPEQRPGHAPAIDTRSIAAPAVENGTLDALAQRAVRTADPTAAATLRPQAVQRLQLRAGNAAVAAMLQRKAAPTVRRPAPVVRKPPPAPSLPVARTTAPGGTTTTSETAAPVAETAATETPTTDRSANVSTTGLILAGASPPPPDGLPIQRSLASMIEEARRRAAPPAGPDDTKTVEGDTDLSEFTDAPAKAAEERKAIPPPPPPPLPATPGAVASASVPKAPPKPPKKKVGKALVAGPKPKPKAGGPGAKGAPKPGEVVKKPAPPLPPVHVKTTKAGATVPPPPVPPKPIKPGQDPAFAKVVTAAKMTVKKAKKHPNGKAESAAAQGAAVPPGSDIEYQAKANRIDTMATAKPKPFDEEAFVAAVADAMRKSAPKNLSEAGDVNSKSAGVKDVIGKKVAAGKQAAGGDVEAKATQPPDPSTATPKPVTPMEPLKIEEPGGMKASGAMPAPVPNEQVDFRHGPAKVDNEMADAGVTEQQLAESNEPEFTGALDAKKEGEEHAKEAPAQVRQAEAQILKQATVASAAEEKKAVSEANSTIGSTIAKVGGQKDTTKSKDELKRKEVADHINSLFDKTKTDVEGILSGLETTVDDLFTTGEAAIRKSFTEDWNRRLDAYKDDRYSGLRGPFRWARDKFKGLPAKANQLFEQSKAVYERDMQKLVRRIAQTVSAELNKATVRIEQGRGEVAAYVGSLKGDLAKFGQEAAADINDKFDNLDSSVKDKFDDLAGSLAKKYSESQEAVAAEIEAAQEANKGLIAKAVDAVKGVIKVISQLKDMILNVLSRIAGVVGEIIAHPIKFLKNFVNAVKGGITRFMERIGEHLQKGLMGWLFGTLDAKGIEIPDSFSLEGIMKLVMSVLGMTWTFVRERIAKKIGEPAMNALESGADLIKKVVTGGPGVLWEMIVEKFTEFQDMVVGEIKNFVIEKVVKSGITFLISLLNPAAAFIKACKMIYDVVMFFVERGSQIKEFVDSLIDAAGDVAKGGGGGIPEKIEGVLAKVLPLAISFLASLLGLGGVGDKVRSIIDKVRNPIHRAMDKVIDVVLRMTAPIWKPAKKLFEKGKKLYGKAKDKAKALYEKGKDKVKRTYEAGKAKAKDLYGKGKQKVSDAGAWVKDKAKGGLAFIRKALGLPKIEKFAMNGARHSITADAAGSALKLVMASQPGDLFSKIAKEHDDAEASGDRTRVAEIDSIARLAQDIRGRGNKAIGAVDEDKAKKAADGIDELMERLGKSIAAYADKYKLKDFGAGAGAVKTPAEELGGPALERIALEAETLAITAKQQKQAPLETEAEAIATGARAAKTTDADTQKSLLEKYKGHLTALRKKLGVEGTAGEGIWTKDVHGVVGEVGKHGDQGGRGRSTGAKELWLESEHVVPRGWLNLFLQETHNVVISPEMYDGMTTIMLYASAAKLKTNKDGSPASAPKSPSKGGDNPVYRDLKKALAGRGAGGASAALTDVRTGMRGLLTSRVEKTMDAVAEDDATFGAKRDLLKAPKGPARSQVNLAAERQLAEIDDYVKSGGGRSRDGVTLEEVTKTFDMAGEKHKIIFTPPGKLEMASERGMLVQKLNQTITILESGDPKPELQIRELRAVLKLAEQVEDAGAAASALSKEALEAEDTPEPVKKLQQLFDALANAIDAYGDRYHKKDLPKEPEGKNVGIPYDEGKTAEDLKETDLYKKFGMPARNAHQAVRVAAQYDVTILVRPTNPTAPVLLERGLLPKPMEIKAKTINSLDVILGAHAGITKEDIGKVGFFDPQLPDQGSMDEDAYRRLYTRFVQRQKEQVDDARKIGKKIKEGKLELRQGKLVDKPSQKEFTGDHDLYAVLDAGGRPLVDVPPDTKNLKLKETVVAALKGGTFNAQHGAHLDWVPTTPEEKRIFNVIVKAHEGGEPLLKITGSGCSVAYHKPVYMGAEE